jgi:hypothetical protein
VSQPSSSITGVLPAVLNQVPDEVLRKRYLKVSMHPKKYINLIALGGRLINGPFPAHHYQRRFGRLFDGRLQAGPHI